MAGVTKYAVDQDAPHRLLFSNVQTTKRKHSARRNLTIHVSRDYGISWPVRRTIESGPSAYSDLAVLPDGTIGCFYESGWEKPLVFTKFALDWIGARA